MRLLFLHGWGFDATVWDGVRAALAQIDTIVWDRGYFGTPAQEKIGGPFLAIGHSLGSLLLASNPPPGCAGLVAINGFDRFVGEGCVEARIVDRMQSRFTTAPQAVLDAFRRRVGCEDRYSGADLGRLAADLDQLRMLDARGRISPKLVLHGGKDEILSSVMRERVFADARRVTLADGGHLLPRSHPSWCADRIRELIA